MRGKKVGGAGFYFVVANSFELVDNGHVEVHPGKLCVDKVHQ